MEGRPHVPKGLIYVKNEIDEYYYSEFGEFADEEDFSDLKNVPLAYTVSQDGQHEYQVSANLKAKQLDYYVDGFCIMSRSFKTYAALGEEIGILDFCDYIAQVEEAYEVWKQDAD